MLNNWEKAIENEICTCEEFVNSEETYQIKRINLKEITTIVNIGKYL